jgi:3D (Asp-Asp-Asp) domain-containing protein
MKRGLPSTIGTLILGLALAGFPLHADHLRIRGKKPVRMKATAYAQKGTTASGDPTRRGVIAADPHVLPLGTKVKVSGAGEYSGTYAVKDTGKKIKGRKIDVFTPSRREAKKFGKKDVKVRVVKPAPQYEARR